MSNQLLTRVLMFIMTIGILIGFVITPSHATNPSVVLKPGQQAFFDHFKSMCGARFEGEAVFPEDPGDAWRDQLLVAVIETCDADEIRIPLKVGKDTSRTWVLARTASGLQLKHDHRHADGTPDEVTLYGGVATEAGTPLSQSFPADSYTAELIPEAATNEWFLDFSNDGLELTYYLERHGKPRFKAVLKRQP